jgi:hypothetical protein
MNAIRNGVWTLALAAVGAGVMPERAVADDWSFSIGGAPRYIAPVYSTQARTVVVPAQYEERSRQVWIEPVYEERRTLVTIPPRTEIRSVPRFVNGRFVGHDRQTVIVEAGRQEWRTDRVLVQEGRWETVVDRILVAPERTEVVYEQVVVQPGYWESAPGITFGYVDRDDDHHHRHPRPVYVGPRGGVRVRR